MQVQHDAVGLLLLKGCQEFLAGRIALDTDVHHFQDALQGPAHRRIVVDHGNMDSPLAHRRAAYARSEEHTSELQSLMRISYAVFCLKKKMYQITIISRVVNQ